jgi:D-glycero-D-manno-heptose 1,7-bisphosphate phosphatase
MKLVIVDRDGTLNVEREGFLQSPDDWQALPGALDAIARLNHAGFQVVIAANWPGLGRGQVDMATVNAIHARMNKQLAAAGGRIEAIYFCPHAPDEGCTCRKPQPGLLRQIGERYKIDLARTPWATAPATRRPRRRPAAGCTWC